MSRYTLVLVFVLNIFHKSYSAKTPSLGNAEDEESYGQIRRKAPDEQSKSLAEVLATHRCVPTAVSRGPCHSCVCSNHGVYFCRSEKCTDEEKDSVSPTDKPECEPNMLYNEGGLWCNCNPHGRWRSVNCRVTFRYMRNKKQLRSHPDLPPNVTCSTGEFYASDCNICECKTGVLTQSHCTNRTCVTVDKGEKCKLGQILRLPNEICACSEIGLYVSKLCVRLRNDKPIQRLDKHSLSILTFNEKNTLEIGGGTKCTPDTVIRKDCNTCRCTSTGQMICTNKLCISSIGPEPEFMRSDRKKDKKKKRKKSKISNLPELPSRNAPCTPGKKYRYKCNTCQCNNKGEPTCTTMYCLDDYKDKILRDDGNRKLERPVLPNIKKGEICEPGKAYKMDCNVCRCTPSRELICTKMLCLSKYNKRTRYRSSKKKDKKDYKRENKKHKQEKKSKREHEKAKRKGKEKKALRKEHKYPDLPVNKKCVPGEIYSKGCQRCFCNDNKIPYCTNKPCEEMAGPVKVPRDVYPKVLQKEFDKFSELAHEAARCHPGRSYRINCNHCLCLANGNLLCNNLLCLAVDEVNRIAAIKASGKPCDDKTLLDVKPKEDCMTCTCKKLKTACEPVARCTPYRIRRRNLHGELTPQIKPEVALEEDASTCMPGMVYRQKCNNCYCQEDGSVRCTRKGCLNYQQVQSLKAQRERLLKLQGEQEHTSTTEKSST